MSETAHILDLENATDQWTQEGVFDDANGVPVRSYDDVTLLREIFPENDPNAAYRVPAGTTATVLFFAPKPDGIAQLELDWYPDQAIVLGYEEQRFLRLHMRNEVKYPRFGLSSEQISYVWNLAGHAAHGAWAMSTKTVNRSRALFGGHIDEAEKRSLFEELLRLAAEDESHAWEAPTLTGIDTEFAQTAYKDIRADASR